MRNNERIIVLIITALVLLASARTALDTDMWWHMRAGELTLSQGNPVLVDFFSFTRQGVPWVNHSWLAQVLLYESYKILGFWGLSALVSLTVTTSVVLVYYQMAGAPLARAFLLVLTSSVAAVVWSPRPQIFSLVLFALLGLLLHRYREGKAKNLWYLPLLFVAWSNLHGGYVLGLILIGVVVTGEIANRWLSPETVPMAWPRVWKLSVILCISAAVVVVNPNGFKMWQVPFETVNQVGIQQLIEEWASPDFHQLTQQPFLWLLFSTFVVMVLTRRRSDMVDVLVFVIFAYMGLTSRRFFAPFALAVTPVLSRHIQLLCEDCTLRQIPIILSGTHHLIKKSIWRYSINALIVVTLFTATLVKLYQVNRPAFISETMQRSYPVKTIEWIRQNQPSGNMLNEYNWGGYLIWELRDYPVFIDGRTDLFGSCGLNEWLMAVGAGEFWEAVFQGYNIGFTVLQPDRPINQILLANGWQQVYRDAVSVIMVRP